MIREKDKFTGTFGQDINQYLLKFEETCRDYNLSEEQMLWYFHNLFNGEPKRFFGEHITTIRTSYVNAKKLLLAAYGNVDRQSRTGQYLQKFN